MLSKPAAFLNIRVHDLEARPGLSGLCVGYEGQQWRATQFAQHILEWLPEFALRYSEALDFNSGNAVRLIKDAARRVYETKKFQNRGEFGELILHAAIRQAFDSLPAISKIFYKSALNETVKGFDAVHVVGPPDNMELWLGEAKFYSKIEDAIQAVVGELATHTATDYLRNEFLLIRGKVDSTLPHATALNTLIADNTSLDTIFSRACLAVLLTYDSECLDKHLTCDSEYIKAFEDEIRAHHATFSQRNLPKQLHIHLFLLPLKTKELLLKALDEKLKLFQSI